MLRSCPSRKGIQYLAGMRSVSPIESTPVRFSMDLKDGNSVSGVSPFRAAYSIAKLKVRTARPNASAVMPNSR